ncbi:L,D-transpeptidase [Lentilactobacillus laojiaonis]|uniref:L,D-transpeptidase n=1 Tax=Lentilactobacillus laojiaonis TaxID=2883998 RepID=UPI001D0B1667|nr:L,D-transpeptidase [Lentilactobacillus laojiaonis]UDM32194.1 L,D-transpeptidase [Lentilactobacillus laojiaonis]
MKKSFIGLSILLMAVGLVGCSSTSESTKSKPKATTTQTVKKPVKKTVTKVNWRKPSENKPYPTITAKNGRYLYVSIKKQRTYVMSPKNKVLYTMYASTGKNNSTPRGTFSIQAERGDTFYNAESKEGANYWTSFKDHGIYLFHTVPVDQNGKYVVKEADQLGKESNSHGCVRLTIPDAKWINEHVPFGTKVVIK